MKIGKIKIAYSHYDRLQELGLFESLGITVIGQSLMGDRITFTCKCEGFDDLVDLSLNIPEYKLIKSKSEYEIAKL